MASFLKFSYEEIRVEPAELSSMFIALQPIIDFNQGLLAALEKITTSWDEKTLIGMERRGARS
jgi:hypothetical protein